MPVIDADGCPIHVEVTGPDGAPALMLSNSLGTTLHMWDAQIPAFSEKFRVVRYDRRGHGRSGVSPGPYSMARFGQDAIAIMDALGLQKVNWLGLSMGGMVGQWLGANAPDRIAKLILSNTTSHYADKAPWDLRIKTIREKGLGALADTVMTIWFTERFRKSNPDDVGRMRAMLTATPPEGYVACCEAIRDMDLRDGLPSIKAPTLVIAGEHDPATNIGAGEYIRSHIPGAGMIVLDAAHISNVEQPEAYAKEVLAFLGK
ncbi:MAG: 3-oxoadipate enol-lactonase [Pseudorhodoplanes sp.]